MSTNKFCKDNSFDISYEITHTGGRPDLKDIETLNCRDLTEVFECLGELREEQANNITVHLEVQNLAEKDWVLQDHCTDIDWQESAQEKEHRFKLENACESLIEMVQLYQRFVSTHKIEEAFQQFLWIDPKSEAVKSRVEGVIKELGN